MTDGPSKSARALAARFKPYVGQRVTIAAPGYKALDSHRGDQEITGTVVGLAWREIGRHAGTVYDMVLRTDIGMLRTIALSRIVQIRVQAESRAVDAVRLAEGDTNASDLDSVPVEETTQ